MKLCYISQTCCMYKNCCIIVFYGSVQDDPAVQFDGCLAESTFPACYEKQTLLPCRKALLPNPTLSHMDHVHVLHDKSVKIYFNMGILFYLITVASYFQFVSIEVQNIDMFLKTCVLEGVVRDCQSNKNTSNNFFKNNVQSTACIATTK